MLLFTVDYGLWTVDCIILFHLKKTFIMKTYFIIIIISLFTIYSCSVSKSSTSPILVNQLSKDSRGNDMLLGKCTRSALQQAPFADWFKPNYDSYVVDSFTCN